MRVILISEKRLDELVATMLAKMELSAAKMELSAVHGGTLSFGRVNYDVRVLVDEIKKGEVL